MTSCVVAVCCSLSVVCLLLRVVRGLLRDVCCLNGFRLIVVRRTLFVVVCSLSFAGCWLLLVVF